MWRRLILLSLPLVCELHPEPVCAVGDPTVVSEPGVARGSKEGDRKKRLREAVGCELHRRRSGSKSARISVGVASIDSMKSWEGVYALYAHIEATKSAQQQIVGESICVCAILRHL